MHLRTLICNPEERSKMDRLDYLIMSELLRDAQMPFAEIAGKLDTSPYTVKRRYERMNKQGLLFKRVLSIDLSKLGYQGKAFLYITLAPNTNRKETAKYLLTVSNIIVVSELIGPFDILAIAPISDLDSVRTVVNQARKAPNVERVQIACINDTQFPVNPNFGKILSLKTRALATT